MGVVSEEKYQEELAIFNEEYSKLHNKHQANKFDDKKLRMELIPAIPQIEYAKVLTFGATKYCSIFADKLENILQKWNVKTARKIDIFTAKDYVAVAMKNNCLISILNIEKKLPIITKNIDKETVSNFFNSIGIERKSEEKTQNTESRREIHTILENTVLPQMNLIEENNSAVSFVERKKALCTQTTIIELENFVVSFAVSAITGLDSSMMTLLCLEKLLNIYLDKNSLIIPGDDNWRKEEGLLWGRIIGALERHLYAIKNGEDYDPETGLLHSAHIMCNAAFLTEYYHTFPQNDDRFYKNLK